MGALFKNRLLANLMLHLFYVCARKKSREEPNRANQRPENNGCSKPVSLKHMSHQELVQHAEQIATQAHEGQFRRDGVVPYIEHPKAVAGRVSGDAETQAVAWLHDVIEDSDHTADTLLKAGIPSHLVSDVVLLTKTREMVYEDYLDRIASSPIATKVKIADMLSNLADKPTKKQIRKYAKGLLKLTHEI